MIGDRAEMSWLMLTSEVQQKWVEHTNDLLYESKLSREILKGSFSQRRLRWFDEVVDVLDLVCQKVDFSCCGEGCRGVSQCLFR